MRLPFVPIMFTRKVLKSAWLSSLPVLMGYLTMGFAAGVLFAGRIQAAFRTLRVNMIGKERQPQCSSRVTSTPRPESFSQILAEPRKILSAL